MIPVEKSAGIFYFPKLRLMKLKLEHLKYFGYLDGIEDYYYSIVNSKLYIQLRYGYPTEAVVGFAREIINYSHDICGIDSIGITCREWKNFIDVAAIRDFETNLSYN